MGLRHKDLISIHDLEVGEVATILDVAKKLKRKQKRGEPHRYLEGKTLAMIFSKASTRTRVSFETGFYQLGGHPIYLNDSASQIGRGEPVRDTARVLSDWPRRAGTRYRKGAFPFCGRHYDKNFLARKCY